MCTPKGQDIIIDSDKSLEENKLIVKEDGSFVKPDLTKPFPKTIEEYQLPFIPECEVISSGCQGQEIDKLSKHCPKKDGHASFIPVKKFTVEHLPPTCRDHNFMSQIKVICALTVKLVIFYTSPNRPDTYSCGKNPYPYHELKGVDTQARCGTGCIMYDSIQCPVVNQPCPCSICKSTGRPEKSHLRLIVGTATHVVHDDLEAKETVCECFYDSEDGQGIMYLYGLCVKVVRSSYMRQTDFCELVCVTHDQELIRRLRNITMVDSSNYNRQCVPSSCSQGVIVSHPHGRSKHVSVGNIFYSSVLKDPTLEVGVPLQFEEITKCLVPSSLLPCSPTAQKSDHIEVQTFSSTSDSPSWQVRKGTYNSNINSDNMSNSRQHSATSETSSKNIFSNIFNKLFSSSSSRSPSNPTTTTNSATTTTTSVPVAPPPVEYRLPQGMSFTLPPDSTFLGFFHHPAGNHNIRIQFPEGTRFTSLHGKEVSLPKETTFFSRQIDNHLFRCLHFITYDIATCNGCSGAAVLPCSYKGLGLFVPHAGALPEGNNRSSLTPVFGLFTK